MNTPLSPEALDRLARKRAGAKMGWYIHATVYVCVNAALLGAAFLMGRHWAIYPLLGWGVGLALHGIAVWGMGAGSQWRERLVQQEREKLQRQNDQRRRE
jgi:hypothetical protein